MPQKDFETGNINQIQIKGADNSSICPVEQVIRIRLSSNKSVFEEEDEGRHIFIISRLHH